MTAQTDARDERRERIVAAIWPHLPNGVFREEVEAAADAVIAADQDNAAEVRAAYAHELAEKIRAELPETVKESLGGGVWEIRTVPTARQAADLIDPARPDNTTGA